MRCAASGSLHSPLPQDVVLHGGAVQLALHVGLSVVEEGVDGPQGATGHRHAALAVVHGCRARPEDGVDSPDAASGGMFEVAIRKSLSPWKQLSLEEPWKI